MARFGASGQADGSDSDSRNRGGPPQIDTGPARAHRADEPGYPLVNADCNFPTCAEVKFPSLAGVAITRGRDRRLRLLRADRAGEASAGSARSGYSLWS